MSTLTTAAQPGVATALAAIHWQDYGGDSFNTNLRVKATAVIADIAGVAGLADVLSQAHICADGGLTLSGQNFNVTGQDAATNNLYARKTDILEFEFRSRNYCGARAVVQIPSPNSGLAGLFADSTGGQRNVNLTQTDVAAFVTAITAILAVNDVDVTDWYCVNAERVTTSVNYAGKRPS